MRVTTIGHRIAAELRNTDIVSAGLKQAHYPAPSSLNETPAAVVFAGSGNSVPAMQEQVWHHDVRVQVMVKPGQSYAGSLNAIEPLIEPIWDHFAPGTDASHLRGSDGSMVEHCYPIRYEASQLIEFAGIPYVALTIYFDVKTHRFAGAE
jgi:hypothetical protein